MTPEQQSLFGAPEPAEDRPERIGSTEVSYRDASSILTPASGFMAAYDYTLNPYSGCGFGCTYCYAAFFSRDVEMQRTWGQWVEVKQNAVAMLRRMKKPPVGKSIYMSSVTDPYQPVEKRLGLVRSLLEELVVHQPRLVIQTRSPLVTRDIDLLSQFEHARVNMTVTTDSEDVRKVFELGCPGNRFRLVAIGEVQAAGIETSVTITPLLPVADAVTFAASLRATGVQRFVVQPFHADRGRFVAGTHEGARELIASMDWDDARFRETVAVLRRELPHLDEGQEGFTPE